MLAPSTARVHSRSPAWARSSALRGRRCAAPRESSSTNRACFATALGDAGAEPSGAAATAAPPSLGDAWRRRAGPQAPRTAVEALQPGREADREQSPDDEAVDAER